MVHFQKSRRVLIAAAVALVTGIGALAATPEAQADSFRLYIGPSGPGYYHGPRVYYDEGYNHAPRYRHRVRRGSCHYHEYKVRGLKRHRDIECHGHRRHPSIVYVR